MKRSKSNEDLHNKKSKVNLDMSSSDISSSTDKLMLLLSRQLETEKKSSLPPSPSFQLWFNDIAECICNELILVIGNKAKFKIVEIEMYLKYSNHYDSFSHSDDKQLNTCGEWYFHRQNGKSYKGGTYKGLDITFGTIGKAYGGILIRSIENLENGEVIEGPCRVVDKILSCVNRKSIVTLVESKQFVLNVTDLKSILRLESINSSNDINLQEKEKKRMIISSPRVGLTLKRCDDFKPYFLMLPYRFHTRPDKVTKYKSMMILSYWKSNGAADIKEIAEVFDITISQVEKLTDAFEKAQKGKHKKKITDFVGIDFKADVLVQLCAVTM